MCVYNSTSQHNTKNMSFVMCACTKALLSTSIRLKHVLCHVCVYNSTSQHFNTKSMCFVVSHLPNSFQMNGETLKCIYMSCWFCTKIQQRDERLSFLPDGKAAFFLRLIDSSLSKWTDVSALKPISFHLSIFLIISSSFVRSTKVYLDRGWSERNEKPPWLISAWHAILNVHLCTQANIWPLSHPPDIWTEHKGEEARENRC